MTDNADLIARLRSTADALEIGLRHGHLRKLLLDAADALAARDAACGQLDNQLVAKALTFLATGLDVAFTVDESLALRAAIFEATG